MSQNEKNPMTLHGAAVAMLTAWSNYQAAWQKEMAALNRWENSKREDDLVVFHQLKKRRVESCRIAQRAAAVLHQTLFGTPDLPMAGEGDVS
jgi:hypothetical protein